MRAVVFAMTLAIAGCSVLSSTKTCTLVGCGDSVKATFQLDRTVSELRGGSVRVCRDDECVTAQLGDRSPSVVGRTGEVTIDCSGDPTSKTFTVFLVVQPGKAREGERFDVVVLAPNGEPVASRRGTVEYTVTRPNGPDCEPECRQGELI